VWILVIESSEERALVKSGSVHNSKRENCFLIKSMPEKLTKKGIEEIT
jgi:hypothetical protein